MVRKESLYGYLNALKRIFVIEDSPAWNDSLEEKSLELAFFPGLTQIGLLDRLVNMLSDKYAVLPNDSPNEKKL